MLMTDPVLKSYKVLRQEDISLIPFDTGIKLEVYGKNLIFNDVETIVGDVLIRGVNCRFPQLKELSGSLSVDAEGASLPLLNRIGGNCTLHYRTQLQQLHQVTGNFKSIVDHAFNQLEKIGGTIVLKKAKVSAQNTEVRQLKKKFVISIQKEVLQLPADGIFDLEIQNSGITIPHEFINGNLIIQESNCLFPNLKQLNGSLEINSKNQVKRDGPFTAYLPKLEVISRNCFLEGVTATFENLQIIEGKLSMTDADVSFLKLRTVRNIGLYQKTKAKFPVLETIAGNLASDNISNGHGQFDELIRIGGHASLKNASLPKLVEVKGDLSILDSASELSALSLVRGTLTPTKSITLPQLTQIGNFDSSRVVSCAFPALTKIDCYLFSPNLTLEQFADNTFFKVSDRLFISKQKAIITRMGFTIGLKQDGISLKKLIAVLKLRHTHFEHFLNRTFETEWQKYEHPLFKNIIAALQKEWDKIKPVSFDHFFTSTNRNYRLFCFNYIGVGTLMKALNAVKLSEKSIKVNYFQYDSNGNKKEVSRLNVYEIHQIENAQLQLNTWWSNGKHSYAVKCWCPSTQKEHWLWIEEQYKDDPLKAIASTFRVHENIIPFIKCLKRQGDLLFCEMRGHVIPEGEIRPLSAKEYFSLLVVES